MFALYVGGSVVYALLCLVPALMKIRGTAKMRDAAQHFGLSWPRYRRIGLLELAAAAAVLVGIGWRPAGLVGAGGMVLLLLGALEFHRRAGDPVRDVSAAIVFLVAAVAYLALWATVPSGHWS